MLLLTAVQMIPSVSNAQFMELIVGLVPVDYKSLAFRVVNDLSLKSPATMISVTAITALWSAGRGMFSVARGLNRVHGHGEKRWYVVNRLICSGYTIVFIPVSYTHLDVYKRQYLSRRMYTLPNRQKTGGVWNDRKGKGQSVRWRMEDHEPAVGGTAPDDHESHQGP